MNQKSMIKQFRGCVVLGLPSSPLSFLLKMRKQYGLPHLFLRRCPLWLRLFPLANVHISAAQLHSEILSFELTDLAAKQSEKLLTLIPCTKQASAFVKKNRGILEPHYILQIPEVQNETTGTVEKYP